MTVHAHPSSGELLAALDEPDQATRTLDHVNECLACRVRLARLRSAQDLVPTGEDIFQRLIDASTPPPVVVADLVAATAGQQPQPNEIWRVGRGEALLVWVRQVFDDGIADVVPVVLDVDLADQQSILVAADATPLATPTAAIVALRAHIHPGAFLNHVGLLDISREVAEVLTSVAEGRRPSGVPVGPPIDDDRDQRLEYRQALRDLLAELSPSAWLPTAEEVEAPAARAPRRATIPPDGEDLESIKSQLTERLAGIRFIDSPKRAVAVNKKFSVQSEIKISYLNTAVLVIAINVGSGRGYPQVELLAAACLQLAANEPDVDAVLVAVPHRNWPSQLFPLANLRSAYRAPDGSRTGPEPTLDGLGLVDTLCKHLEGVTCAWEVVEAASSRVGRTDLLAMATRHAAESIAGIKSEGRRARQPAKQAGWGGVNDSFNEHLARFVLAVINNADAGSAMTELLQVIDHD